MFSTRYNHHSKELAGVVFEKPSLVRSEFQNECDINHIMARYYKTGIIDHVSELQAVFSDVSELPEYQGMLDAVTAASEAFGELPSSVRKRFGNDPSELMAFLSDPDNTDEAISLGLVERPALPVQPDSAKPNDSELASGNPPAVD